MKTFSEKDISNQKDLHEEDPCYVYARLALLDYLDDAIPESIDLEGTQEDFNWNNPEEEIPF